MPDGAASDIWETAPTGADTMEGAEIENYNHEELEGIGISVAFANYDELLALNSSDAFEGPDTVTIL